VTGAGDAFNACLTVNLMRGRLLRDAAREAIFAGAYCTQHLGVIDGLPTRGQLEEFKKRYAR
jgi:sugar/nucleoside kinase (ribokinase family)